MMHSDSATVGQRLTIEAAKAAAAGRRAGLNLPPEHINPVGDQYRRPRRWAWMIAIGTLAPGRNADVVIWSGDPFSIYTKADQVFIDGRRLAYEPLEAPQRAGTGFCCWGRAGSGGCLREPSAHIYRDRTGPDVHFGAGGDDRHCSCDRRGP